MTKSIPEIVGKIRIDSKSGAQLLWQGKEKQGVE